jgi:hypothetical protein
MQRDQIRSKPDTLLVTLIVLCIRGIMMTTDAFWGVQWVDDLHKAARNFSLILVALHVTGVIIASLEHNETSYSL